MRIPRFALILSTVLLICGAISAQTTSTEPSADKEKAKKELEKRIVEMLDQAIGEAVTLKLPHNRAIVYALAGDMMWKFDEKRAGELFRRAGGEILIANAESEKDKRESDDPYASVFEFSDVRNEILPLVAKHDPDLALEMLIQTRPVRIVEALAKASLPVSKQDDGPFSYSPERYRVQQEIALEQRFALLTAEHNPDKSIKLIKESLDKGISWNVLPLLQKLHQKAPKKATELADDVVKKITEIDLTKKRDDLEAAVRFLQFSTNPNKPVNVKDKPFKFTDEQLAGIANKLAVTFLQPSTSTNMTMTLSRVMLSLEKLVPERIPLLKVKLKDAMSKLPPEMRRLEQQQKLWDANSTPEEILTLLPKLQEFEKISAHESLIRKISQIDDETRARKLIGQIPDEKTRERALEQFESARISREARDGKLDEAKKMIGNLSKKKTQVQRLVALATEFHRKGGEENIETAAGLMKDAKGLTNEFPEDGDELIDLLEVVKGYAIVDKDEAFRLFGPIIDQINDVVQASATLSKYNKRNRSFKKGELLMRTGGSFNDGLMIFQFSNQIEMLGKADLHRMSSLTDRLNRSDARTIVKLLVVQGHLKEEKKVDTGETEGGAVYYIEY